MGFVPFVRQHPLAWLLQRTMTAPYWALWKENQAMPINSVLPLRKELLETNSYKVLIPNETERNRTEVLSLNENQFAADMPLSVNFDQLSRSLAYYPVGSYEPLSSAQREHILGLLSQRATLPQNQWDIVFGAGSSDLIRGVVDMVRTTPGQGNLLMSASSYPAYRSWATQHGMKVVEAPTCNHGHDLQAFLKRISDDTRIVVITNPNNPTGTSIPYGDISIFLDKLRAPGPIGLNRPDLPVLIDQAYGEYMPKPNQAEGYEALLVKGYSNVMIMGTYSKAYGLAAARVGYLTGHISYTSQLCKLMANHTISTLSLALAHAALMNETRLLNISQQTKKNHHYLKEGLSRLGFLEGEHYPPTEHAPFIWLHLGKFAPESLRVVKEMAIARPGLAAVDVKLCASPSDSNQQRLRISIGRQDQMDAVLGQLTAVLECLAVESQPSSSRSTSPEPTVKESSTPSDQEAELTSWEFDPVAVLDRKRLKIA